MGLRVAVLVVMGLMCGSELNVAIFSHPVLSGQLQGIHIPVRAALARLLGRVMPFWMAISALLNIALLFPFQHLNANAWRSVAIALIVQLLAIVFSLIGPVPINNRIGKWTPETLPENWKSQERRWDGFHALRTIALILAFAALCFGLLMC